MTKNEILEIIEKEITSWPYVSSEINRFDGIEFRINKREMGHIHNEGIADLPFPMDIRNELVSSGIVKPHHVLPKSRWVSYWFHNNVEHVQDVIELFRIRYEQLKPKNQNKITIKTVGIE